MSSKVGGIARAPVWGANPFLQNNNNFFFRLFPFVSFPQTSEDFMTWGSPRARVYVKCVGTVRAASHPPVWIHRKCELRSLKKMLNSLCWDDDYTIAQWLEHR